MVVAHCSGVHPYSLTHKAEQVGDHPQEILAGRRMNEPMVRYAARPVVRMMRRNGINVARRAAGVLGVTFKEACPDIRNGKVAIRD
jgi:UDP-N-acetyl-D-galactosamine dehydrogenase